MDISFMHEINYLAVLASSIVCFIIGSVWYSPFLMSPLWVEELKRHNVTITMPTNAVLYTKMALSMASNMVLSFAMACLVILTESTTWQSGLLLGKIAALGFAATALASVFVWENRSVKLFLIDVGYPIISITASAILLSVWR